MVFPYTGEAMSQLSPHYVLIARANMISYSLGFSACFSKTKTQNLLLTFLFPRAILFIPFSSHLVCMFSGAGMFLCGISQKGFCCKCLRESAQNFWHSFRLQTSYVRTGRSVKPSTPHLDSTCKRDSEKHDACCPISYTMHKDNFLMEFLGDW